MELNSLQFKDLDPRQQQPLLQCLLLDLGHSIHPIFNSILLHINIKASD
jgi:hypothetical protein